MSEVKVSWSLGSKDGERGSPLPAVLAFYSFCFARHFWPLVAFKRSCASSWPKQLTSEPCEVEIKEIKEETCGKFINPGSIEKIF